MSNIDHGMHIDSIESLGRKLKSDYAEQVRLLIKELETQVQGTANNWVGTDAQQFRSWWPGKRSKLLAIAEDLAGYGQSALNNAAEQRQASDAGGSDNSVGTIVRPTGPTPVAVRETVSGVDSKSGAIIRGVDGSEIRYREMSDGTFQVEVTLASGTTVDVGDAAELWAIAHGKFFSEGGVQWDLDATYTQEGSTTFTLSDAASAKRFFDALQEKQASVGSRISGLMWSDVLSAADDLDPPIDGSVEWDGYRGANHFSAEGSFGFSVGDAGDSAASGVELSGLHGASVSTRASDGSTGELMTMSGSVGATGEIKLGDFSLDGSTVGDYAREVHLIRDANGNPLRLEVTETFGATATASGGVRFLGTGASHEVSQTGSLSSTTVFDLSDPSVAANFNGGTDASSLYAWSREHQNLGGQTVAQYAGSGDASSSSLLFSGEWNESGEQSTLTGSSYRAPGSSTYVPYVPDMRTEPGMHSQIVRENDGSTSVVITGEY